MPLPPAKLTRRDFGIAALLGIAYFALLAATSHGIGYVRDEGHYFRAAEVYNRWFSALWDDIAVVRKKDGQVVRAPHIRGDRESGLILRQPEGRLLIPASEIASVEIQKNPDRARVFERGFIDSIWRENSEHPVLMKALFTLSWRVFYEQLGWANQGDAFRIPAWFFSALLIALVFLWTTELYGRRTGLFAALTLVSFPHTFYHAHLACFDVPMVTMWFAILYAFWKAQKSTYWAITMGPLFAIALATKHNAFFLPFLLVVYWLASRWREFGLPREGGVRRLRLPPLPVAFLAIVLIAPFVYYAHWPWIWNDGIRKMGAYMGYHMSHEHYDVPYLGTILKHPPFPIHFPFLMSFFTLPELSVLLGGFGFCFVSAKQVPARTLRWIWRHIRRRPAPAEPASEAPALPEPLFPVRAARLFATDQVEILLLLGCFIPFAIIAHPQTPVFGGTKHWMQGLPFVAMFAAVAFNLAANRLIPRWAALAKRPGLAWAGLAALTLAPSAVALYRSHPFGTSYHNLFSGGLNGAARLGNTWQFWGGAFRNVADWLNANAEKGAGICHHKTNTKGWIFYRRDGIIRPDFVGLTGMGRDCRFDRADYYVYQHQPEYQGDEVQTWQQFGTIFPVHVVALDGMPLVSVYKKAVRLTPEGAATGEVQYGQAVVGEWRRDGDATHLSAWRQSGQGRGTCEGDWRGGMLERPGAPPAPAGDADTAFRTLFESCYGTRLPR